jgi:hypothetical protein
MNKRNNINNVNKVVCSDSFPGKKTDQNMTWYKLTTSSSPLVDGEGGRGAVRDLHVLLGGAARQGATVSEALYTGDAL